MELNIDKNLRKLSKQKNRELLTPENKKLYRKRKVIMVYMAHSDGSHGHSNVNSENYSSQCYSLTIIGIEIWERSVRWWFGGRGDW